MKRNAIPLPTGRQLRGILALLLAIPAGVHAQEAPVAEQTLSLKASGLYLTANPLDAPPGSLVNAQNAVIRRRGITEPRRGQAPDAPLPSGAGTQFNAITSFEGSVIAHTNDNKLVRRDNSGAMTAYSGTYAPPAGYPTRFSEAGGGLYATTNAGLVRLDSVSSQFVPAGVPPGLEGKGTVTGTTGWLPFNGTVGYRLVWGRRDGDGALMLGAPSGRIVVTNLAQNSTPVTFTWSRSGTVVTAMTGTAHGLTTGNAVTVNSTSDSFALPIGTYIVTVTSTTQFTVTGGSSGATSGGTGNTYAVGTGSRDVVLTTPIPVGIEYGVDFLQIYRTVSVFTGNQDPGEAMAQVGEVFPTQAEVTAGVMTATDIASFANGPTAYFSPNAGEGGLGGVNDQPPVLTDVVSFKNYQIGIVQAYAPSTVLSLLSTDSLLGLTTADGIVLWDLSGAAERYVALNSLPEGSLNAPNEWSFRYFATGAPAYDLEQTVRSLVRVINLRSTQFYAMYASTPDDLPGKISISTRVATPNTAIVRAINNGKCWSPALQMYFTGTATRSAGIVNLNVAGPHPAITFAVGDQIVVYGSTDPNFPDGVKTLTGAAGANIQYAESGPNVGTGVSLTLYTNVPEQELTQQAIPGSWAMSKREEPDAWPPRFRFKIDDDNAILYRLSAQSDAVVFWTSAGVYRLTGDDENNFTVRPLDQTVQLVAPDTVQVLGNRAVGLTNQGLIAISDLGVLKLSEPLDQLLLPYYSGEETALAKLAADAFGIAYQDENEYLLFLPDLAEASGLAPKQAYTFNTQTGAWVGPWKWTWSGDASQTAGRIQAAYVAKSDGHLYLASGNRLFRERKARNLSDYQDDNNVGIPVDVAQTLQTARNPAAYKQWIETTVLLEAPQPDSAFMYFTTEIDSNQEGGTITNKGYNAIRTYVPLNKSRSARLTVGLRYQIPQQRLSILGVSQTYNTASTRIGR